MIVNPRVCVFHEEGTMTDSEHLNELRELSRQLRELRRGRKPKAPAALAPDDQLQLENPFFSLREVRGEWRPTTQ
jgi:uncharacterized protein YaiI (UPF0178 family)